MDISSLSTSQESRVESCSLCLCLTNNITCKVCLSLKCNQCGGCTEFISKENDLNLQNLLQLNKNLETNVNEMIEKLELSKLKAERDSNEMKDANDNCERLKKEINKYKLDIESLVAKKEKIEKDIDELNKELNESKQENINVNDLNNNLTLKITKLTNEVKTITTKNQELSTELHNADIENKKINNEIGSLQKNKEQREKKLKSDSNLFNMGFEASKHENLQIRKINLEISNDVTRLQKENQILSSKVKELEYSLENTLLKEKNNDKEKEDICEKEKHMNEDIQSLIDKLNLCRQENLTLIEKNEDLLDDNSNLQKELVELREKLQSEFLKYEKDYENNDKLLKLSNQSNTSSDDSNKQQILYENVKIERLELKTKDLENKLSKAENDLIDQININNIRESELLEKIALLTKSLNLHKEEKKVKKSYIKKNTHDYKNNSHEY